MVEDFKFIPALNLPNGILLAFKCAPAVSCCKPLSNHVRVEKIIYNKSVGFSGHPQGHGTPWAPYDSHTTPIRIPKDMGMVWEAWLTRRGSCYWEFPWTKTGLDTGAFQSDQLKQHQNRISRFQTIFFVMFPMKIIMFFPSKETSVTYLSVKFGVFEEKVTSTLTCSDSLYIGVYSFDPRFSRDRSHLADRLWLRFFLNLLSCSC